MELRMAMLGGLLHDLGEMYIDPRFGEADADRSLDFQSYQQLVVHPHVGQLLISQLTDYPKALARAVAEHHESAWTARATRTPSSAKPFHRWAACWPSPRRRWRPCACPMPTWRAPVWRCAWCLANST
jgi:hypothetical protein